MEELLFTTVYYTFVAQTAMFVPLVLLIIWFHTYRGFGRSRKRDLKARKNKNKGRDHRPELQPLSCISCGAGVPLDDTEMVCDRCGTHFPVPGEYEEIRILRLEAAENVRKAQEYWRRASLLSSKTTSGILAFAVVWLGVSLLAILSYVGTPSILPFEQFINKFKVPLFIHLYWIIALPIVAFRLAPRARRNLPVIERRDAVAGDETLTCGKCAGAIRYSSGDFSAVCGYCGVETYRVKVARASAAAESRSLDASAGILSREMEIYSGILEKVIVPPASIIGYFALLIITFYLVVLLFVAGMGAIFVVFYGLLEYPLLTATAIIAIIFGAIYRKRLMGVFRRSEEADNQD